jgi:hypothetical protein
MVVREQIAASTLQCSQRRALWSKQSWAGGSQWMAVAEQPEQPQTGHDPAGWQAARIWKPVHQADVILHLPAVLASDSQVRAASPGAHANPCCPLPVVAVTHNNRLSLRGYTTQLCSLQSVQHCLSRLFGHANAVLSKPLGHHPPARVVLLLVSWHQPFPKGSQGGRSALQAQPCTSAHTCRVTSRATLPDSIVHDALSSTCACRPNKSWHLPR